MQIIIDIINFIKSLAFVDLIFFFAVIALMLLVVVLIYFIRENDEVLTNTKETLEEPLISTKSTEDELKYLRELTEALENAEPSNINLNQYEEEQEEKAIISYEELLKHKNDFSINYSEEENIDDILTVKKVDLANLINNENTEPPKLNVTIISYEKEEAFLEALKTLQQNLN